MASLWLNSLPVPPSSHPRKPTETSLSSSLILDNNNNHSSLKPIVVSGDPPTFVSAPGRRILAVGDLHGDLKQARSALEMAGVLSSDGQDLWTGGETVLVQLGDILDRGEDEIAILSLLRSLDKQAKAKGGAVFQVNGNHETMNVEGDFRYVESGGFDECNDFLEYVNGSEYDWEETFTAWVDVSERWKKDRTLSKSWGPWNLLKRQKGVIARSILFRPGGLLARELARHSVVLKVNDWVFCHGGLLPHHVAYGIERINKEVSEWMRSHHENENTLKIPFIATRGYDSVVWNRLYSRDSPDLVDYQAKQINEILFHAGLDRKFEFKFDFQVCSILDETLQAIGAKAMVVGHTPQTIGVNCKYNCSIWRIDVGMSSGVLNSRPEVLEIIDNRARVIRCKRDRHSELQAAAYT
ncbi:hypothetical protein Fmac_031315 [Flemingia macrophylla]|uniref:Calcineurin-like phosphoesterase domain-containing protein n=1 Tax=Flemingia macrophylla TaxID=520843 RepID=A0ABD1L1Q0_9FABA